MKIQFFLTTAAVMASSTAAFTTVAPRTATTASLTQLEMFGGAGAGAAMEDDPEAQAQIEAAAKSMNMSVEEYKLGMSARAKLTEQLNNARVSAGDKVVVTRDGNNPPAFLDISISEDAKAAGKDVVSKDLVAALKKASDQSRTVRQQAQKDMMAFIQDEAKKLGA